MDKNRIKPGVKVDLSKWDPDDTGIYNRKDKRVTVKLNELSQELDRLQELLYAEHKHKLLIVLQALDTAGKDGIISHVFDGVNPQGVRVAAYRVPTPEELDHDFLWRIHKQVPANGEIVIFNRSHYEDVLVVRVHQLITRAVWQRRYTDINNFERMLADEGTTILKFFLHISENEQKKRLEDRLSDPTKHWKFNISDLAERKLWPEYIKAYTDAIAATSTTWAPWYIVPANKKWYRNLVVASTLVETLKGLDMHYPQPAIDISKIVIV